MNFIDRSSQNICAAINSKSYLNILTYFIAELGLFFARYHIYIDNDIDNWDLYNIKKLLNKFKVEAYIHRNIYPGEKDFGVKRNKIIDPVQDIRRYKKRIGIQPIRLFFSTYRLMEVYLCLNL